MNILQTGMLVEELIVCSQDILSWVKKLTHNSNNVFGLME